MWPILYLMFFYLADAEPTIKHVIGVRTAKMLRKFDRILDVSELLVHSYVTQAGDNQTVSCPGVTEHSLVMQLEWLSLTNRLSIIEFSGNSITIWGTQDRISLVTETFGLRFHPVEAVDTGDYVCLVNSRPNPEAVVRLIVQDVPEPTGRPLITSFSSRAANLSWAPSINTHYSPVTNYIIHTRVGEKGDWNTMREILTPDNRTSYEIGGLHPYTVYSFRVIVVNTMGSSRPSKESYYMVTLREVPTGKPTITTAHNTSSTAIHISWRPPHYDTIHGEFLGYRLSLRARDRGLDSIREIYIRDPAVESHTIQGLQTYTQYLVSLQVLNPEGLGPTTIVLVMTDEGDPISHLVEKCTCVCKHLCVSRMGHVIIFLISFFTIIFAEQYITTTTEIYDTTALILTEVPTKPLNITVLGISSNSIRVAWRLPARPNGVIEGYRVYFLQGNYTDVRTVHTRSMVGISHNVTYLKPDTEYKIWVKAFTGKHEGEPSEGVINRTDIDGPTPPQIVNLTCQKQDTIYIHWKRPARFYRTITYYYIHVASNFIEDNDVIELPARPEHLYTSYSITNVTTNTVYEIRLSAASWSAYTSRLIQGNISQPYEVHMRVDCDKFPLYMLYPTGELSFGMIAGVACAAMSFILAVVAFIIWRKFFHAPVYFLDDPRATGQPAPLNWNTAPQEEVTEQQGPIPVRTFSKHVAELHADGDIGFSKEYEVIQSNQDQHACEHSQHVDNRIKNRYLNIIAYDHTRVELLDFTGQKKGLDYINANYIDGFSVSRAYIGTQGPLPSTFDGFWRMVWEQRVSIIVMITNLVERGRRKCDMYWPKEGMETYGVIQVSLVREDVMATYTIRTLQIRHLRIKKKKATMAEKLVYQYHYTNWPDHGTPDHPLPVLYFVKKSAAANPHDGGPIVVHCSAGVGRTGTYIVIDAMMKQIRKLNEVNIFGFLQHIRTQRNFLVQTEEQYIFIHDALVEAIESGETNISREQFPKYVQTIQGLSGEKFAQWRDLDTQFKLVTSFKCKDFNLVSATKVVNQPKNRRIDIVPVESSRVHLTPKPGEDGSDYVNATWMQGFQTLREFIITQHPLRHTIKDFWQMVWDHNVQTIVMLSIIDNHEYEIFWPNEDETIEAENFRVRLNHERVLTSYMSLEFTMQSLQDDYELHVRMVHSANWPNHCTSLAEFYHLPNTVQATQLGYQNGPVLVVDRHGGSEAALFCCMVTLKKHLFYDNHVDVYMYAKLYHNKRPGIWASIHDYLKLHLAVQTICCPPDGTTDMYVRANGSSSIDTVRMPPEGMEAVGTKLTVD